MRHVKEYKVLWSVVKKMVFSEWSAIKSTVRDSLGRFLYERTRRRPMILPIIMEI